MKSIWRRRTCGLLGAGILLILLSACSLLNRPPVAVITVSHDSGFAPLEVFLDGRGSYDPDGSVVRYEWTTGDGTTVCKRHFSHVYTGQANYAVVLRVTDNDGATASDEVSISVSRLDLTGTWTGVIRDDVDVPLRGPYSLNLTLWQQRSDSSLSGIVEWAAVTGFDINIPITSGVVVGTELHLTASGLFSPDPDHFAYVWYSVHLEGRFDGESLDGTGSWDDGTSFHWTAWK